MWVQRIAIVVVLAGLLVLPLGPATNDSTQAAVTASETTETWYARISETSTPAECNGFNRDLSGTAGSSTTTETDAPTGVLFCWYASARTTDLVSGTWQILIGLHRGTGGERNPRANVTVAIVSPSGVVEDTILSATRAISSTSTSNMETFTATGIPAKSLSNQRIRLSVEKTTGERTLNIRYGGSVGSGSDTRIVHPAPPGPLAADFTFSPDKPVVGEFVTFTATASGGTSPYTFSWTFGDGDTGTGATVTHAFAAAGTYTVALNASDFDGTTTVVSKSVPVTLPVTADFTFTPAQPVVGETVTFSGSATGGTSPYTFSWTFGDGDTGTGANVTHAFTSAGTFTVQLTVSDSAGHTTSVTKSVPVTPTLSANFTFTPTQPVIGQSVSFSGSAAGGTGPYTFAWNFGDGSTMAGSVVSHAYASADTFTVSLQVLDSAGHTATVAKQVTVTRGLAADFTFSPTQPVVGESVTFTATALGGTGPYTFAWNFGDGSTMAGSVVSHAYASADTFTVSLQVLDSAGHTATVAKQVTVTRGLAADFTFSPTQPVVGESVTFTATALGGTGPYTFAWNFGDGSTMAGSVVSHAYASADTFTVSLQVLDSANHTTTVTKSVPVTPPLAANFTFSPTQPVVDQTVTFSGTASGGTSPYTFAWDFGDGVTGSGATVSHSFAATGTYTVTLTASDSASHTTTVAKPIAVILGLGADFTFSPTDPVIGESVSFSGTAAGGTPPYVFAWDFGDGVTGSEATVTHAFASAGTFTVQLTVSDSVGRVTTVAQSVPVTPPLAANFTFSPTQPELGEVVTFTATASGGTPPYTYAWDFGDGSAAAGAVVTHAYASSGTFTVILQVSDSAGHSTGVTKPVPVTPALTAGFTFQPPVPVPFEPVTFSAAASGGTPAYAFAWDFGDGGTAAGATASHIFAAKGTFNVTLTVSDAVGHGTTVTRSVVVSVSLIADFTLSQTFPIIGETVYMFAEARGATPPYTFTWDFGDGATAFGAEAGHAYAATRVFVITLTVVDFTGRIALVAKPIVVTAPLVVGLTFSPERPMAAETIAFTGIPAGGTPPYTLNWTLGDGSEANGSAVHHAYDGPGTFTVNLTAFDSAGHNATTSVTLPVTPTLTANFTFSPTDPVTKEAMTFNASASGGTSPYVYMWDFGEGGTGAGPITDHVYGAAGSFDVSVTVSDLAGHALSVTSEIAVGPGVEADIAFSVEKPGTARVVHFTAGASGGTPPYEYLWEFGDGARSEEANTTHSYDVSGFSATYTVTLTVCDASGRCASAEARVKAENLFPVVALIEVALIAVIGGYWILERRRWAQAAE